MSRDRTGAGLGVERQEADCRVLAERLGWTVVEVFSDNDLSAYSGKQRPQYERMLAAIRDGRIDGVLCWHTDRLHRSPVELEHYISVCEPRGVPTHGVSAGELDLSTASGRVTARITGAIARHESEHKSERICAQKARAAQRGARLGGARAFGYRLVFDREEKPHRIVDEVIEPVEAAAIEDGVQRVLAKESVYSITKSWQASGVRPVRGAVWAQPNVRRILTNPRNAGLVEHRGEIVGKGDWPAIISEDDWRAVCAILKDPERTTYSGVRSLKWVGSGLYRCGVCGSDLRSASLSNRDGSTRRVYRCRSTRHVGISAEPVDAMVIETACRVLDEQGAELVPRADRQVINDLHAEANTLNARLDELADMLGEGELDRARYNRQREKVTAKLEAVNAQLEEAASGSALDGVATAASPSAAFLAQPVARQRSIVDALMTVTVAPAKPGRPPKGVNFDYSRVCITPR